MIEMCDLQNIHIKEDASCEEEVSEMNFAFTTAGPASGTHFVTTTGQLPVTKLQQNIATNGTGMPQVVGMVGNLPEGVQYVRTLDGGASLTATPHVITVPITLPGSKPGDPQQTVQIQVLNNMLQQTPKYQMQIPIQGFQQGAVLTLGYAQDEGIQILGNTLSEGVQVVSLPEMLVQAQMEKDQLQQQLQQQQIFVTQNQQVVINTSAAKINNNNNDDDVEMHNIVVKEECDESNDEEVEYNKWKTEEFLKYYKVPEQQQQALPVSLQQFLKLNPTDTRPDVKVTLLEEPEDTGENAGEAVIGDDGSIRIVKKKKKYKKKPPKPSKPKPGQVAIRTSPDGSVLFCCPECQMAYSEKERLEEHLGVHKIERRYICGLCGAALKRKEHLERHKLGHNPERPYVCSVCCKGFKRREHLNLHAVIHSGVKTEVCPECGKCFYRKDHLRKHLRSHEARRARDGGARDGGERPKDKEITIHVPTSGNIQVPVQINIPPHVVSTLAAQGSPLDPLLNT